MKYFNKKNTQNKETTKLPMTGKLKKGISSLLRGGTRCHNGTRNFRDSLCCQRPDYRSQQPFRFYLRFNPCCRYDFARLRYRTDWSFAQISRPVPESKRLFDPCRWRHHYLCKRDFDSYHRLISDNKKTQDRAYGADPLCGLLRKAILRTEVV